MKPQNTNIISKNGLLKIITKYGYYPYKGKRIDATRIRCEFLSVQYPYVTIALVYDAPITQKDNVHYMEIGGKNISTFQEFMESIKKINETNKQLKNQCHKQHFNAAQSSELSTSRAISSSVSSCYDANSSGKSAETRKCRTYSIKRNIQR